jgi:hypothetical protein
VETFDEAAESEDPKARRNRTQGWKGRTEAISILALGRDDLWSPDGPRTVENLQGQPSGYNLQERCTETRGYPVATASSTGRAARAALRERGLPDERRRKAGQRERALREGHQAQARRVKTFRNAGDATNGTAGL